MYLFMLWAYGTCVHILVDNNNFSNYKEKLLNFYCKILVPMESLYKALKHKKLKKACTTSAICKQYVIILKNWNT